MLHNFKVPSLGSEDEGVLTQVVPGNAVRPRVGVQGAEDVGARPALGGAEQRGAAGAVGRIEVGGAAALEQLGDGAAVVREDGFVQRRLCRETPSGLGLFWAVRTHEHSCVEGFLH